MSGLVMPSLDQSVLKRRSEIISRLKQIATLEFSSLHPGQVSLLSTQVFPVRHLREITCNPLFTRNVSSPILGKLVENGQFPCSFPVCRENHTEAHRKWRLPEPSGV